MVRVRRTRSVLQHRVIEEGSQLPKHPFVHARELRSEIVDRTEPTVFAESQSMFYPADARA